MPHSGRFRDSKTKEALVWVERETAEGTKLECMGWAASKFTNKEVGNMMSYIHQVWGADGADAEDGEDLLRYDQHNERIH